jgi:23S rRNA (adenine2503-C2)-methyltransferase
VSRAGRAGGFGLTVDEIAALSPPNAARIVFERLQRVHDWKDGAPLANAELRAWLDAHLDLSMPRVTERVPSEDGSTKLGLTCTDGLGIEAVHMPRETRSPRVTLCISSQAGCAMGCTFCATAKMGLLRNLTAHEIVGQVLAVVRELGPPDYGRINLVFMGMGEPLHNVEEVLRAVRVLSDPRGLGIALSRITASTAGWMPGIEAIARDPFRPNLAISLNATTDEARARIMPVAKRWSLSELRAALSAIALRPHEKLLVSYVLLAGENDADADATRLAEWASGLRAVVNVIPWNPVEGADFRASDRATAFAATLRAQGLVVTVRKNRGRDANAACGQLATVTSLRKKKSRHVGAASQPAETTPTGHETPVPPRPQ